MKKLQIEEQQRLKTEEQASKMIAAMEKTIKQLVRPVIKRTDNNCVLGRKNCCSEEITIYFGGSSYQKALYTA